MKSLKILRMKKLKAEYNVSTLSNILFFSGILVLISALIFMIVNLYRADLIIWIWLPFMTAGVFLVLMSQMIKWQFPNTNSTWRQELKYWKK